MLDISAIPVLSSMMKETKSSPFRGTFCQFSSTNVGLYLDMQQRPEELKCVRTAKPGMNIPAHARCDTYKLGPMAATFNTINTFVTQFCIR